MYEVVDAFGYEENWEDASGMDFAQKISKKTPAMLKFAKKLTLTPQKVTQEDREELRAGAGLTNEEILGNNDKTGKCYFSL